MKFCVRIHFFFNIMRVTTVIISAKTLNKNCFLRKIDTLWPIYRASKVKVILDTAVTWQISFYYFILIYNYDSSGNNWRWTCITFVKVNGVSSTAQVILWHWEFFPYKNIKCITVYSCVISQPANALALACSAFTLEYYTYFLLLIPYSPKMKKDLFIVIKYFNIAVNDFD